MKSLLVLKRIKVENASAISGIVYGFPAITHFMGYVHRLSRHLFDTLGIKLGGCGIVCHNYQVRTYKTRSGEVFSLTRNPLKKDATPASFNEEGKIHMEVSLVVECDFTGDNLECLGTGDIERDIQKFEELVYQLAISYPLAGGLITNLSSVIFKELPWTEADINSFYRRVLRSLLPGFVLMDRSNVFKSYLSEHPNINSFEALLDFYALKWKATPLDEEELNEKSEAKWNLIPKPAEGWLVPLQLGYKAISPLYKEGEVANVRDQNVPFRFVEPVYGLGEWMGLHRVRDLESILWCYHADNDMYLCLNKFNH